MFEFPIIPSPLVESIILLVIAEKEISKFPFVAVTVELPSTLTTSFANSSL